MTKAAAFLKHLASLMTEVVAFIIKAAAFIKQVAAFVTKPVVLIIQAAGRMMLFKEYIMNKRIEETIIEPFFILICC